MDNNLSYEEKAALYGVCRNGHVWEPSNTLYESSGRQGARRRRCRSCRKEKRQQAQAQAQREILAGFEPRNRRNRGGSKEGPSDDGEAVDYDTALSHTRVRCEGKAETYSDWDEDNPPLQTEAEEMCRGCPILTLCREYGQTQYHGVWGGVVRMEGKNLYEEEDGDG